MRAVSTLFAQQQTNLDQFTTDALVALFVAWLLVIIIASAVVFAFSVVINWMIFTKAGKPGWASLIPFYNLIVLLEIVGRPIWWIVWFIIPCTFPFAAIFVTVDLARVFGKSGAFAVGMIFLPFIFRAILAFDSSRYTPPPPPQLRYS